MQSISSRIWTRVTASISYDDNHYTTDTSFKIVLMAYLNSEWIKKSEYITIVYEVKYC